MGTPHPQAYCINSRLILIEAAVRLEPLHQDLHLLHLSKGQVWDDTQQTLEHTRVRANKGAVDLVQEHHQLILVTREEEVALQQEDGSQDGGCSQELTPKSATLTRQNCSAL